MLKKSGKIRKRMHGGLMQRPVVLKIASPNHKIINPRSTSLSGRIRRVKMNLNLKKIPGLSETPPPHLPLKKAGKYT